MSASRARLGQSRWHFQHGPIDLIIDVDAPPAVRDVALADCWDVFQGVLPTLVGELPLLRRPACERHALHGPVARRMRTACEPFAHDRFITPMAAVAGAVADELIAALHRPGVARASINNGGDIALHLSPGETYRVGIVTNPQRPDLLQGAFVVDHAAQVRGVATSGWRGRSFSLGIADSVTVLAGNAAAADAAATLIANAVDCRSEGIVRAPACQLKDDSDLGDIAVTVQVPPLPHAMKVEALARGRREAVLWQSRGLLHAAVLCLQGCVEIVLPPADASLAQRADFMLACA